MLRSEFYVLVNGYRDFGRKQDLALNQRIQLEVDGEIVEEFIVKSGENYNDYCRMLVREIFETGKERRARLLFSYISAYEVVLYDGQKVEETWKKMEERIREDMEKTKMVQRKMDGWQPALDWARENGANIRKGKISKWLAWVRVDEAGLRDQWNEKFPDYRFNDRDLERAKEVLEDRKQFYSKLKKKGGAK